MEGRLFLPPLLSLPPRLARLFSVRKCVIGNLIILSAFTDGIHSNSIITNCKISVLNNLLQINIKIIINDRPTRNTVTQTIYKNFKILNKHTNKNVIKKTCPCVHKNSRLRYNRGQSWSPRSGYNLNRWACEYKNHVIDVDGSAIHGVEPDNDGHPIIIKRSIECLTCDFFYGLRVFFRQQLREPYDGCPLKGNTGLVTQGNTTRAKGPVLDCFLSLFSSLRESSAPRPPLPPFASGSALGVRTCLAARHVKLQATEPP